MIHADVTELDARIVRLRRQRRTYRQIAEALDVSVGRVKTAVYRRVATGLPSVARRGRRVA